MSNKNSESVKLLIEAEYLAEQEFNQATDDVKALAKESEKTDEALNQLKIDKATIKSYGELGYEIEGLKEEIQDAIVVQKQYADELGKSSKEYKAQSRAVNTLKNDLKLSTKTYNSQATALKGYNITSKAVEQTIAELNDKIEKSTIASKEQSKALKDANVALEQSIIKQRALSEEKKRLAEVEGQLALERKQLASTMKEEFAAQDKLNKATAQAVAERKKELDQAEKREIALKAEKKALNDTKNALKEYEQKLSQLNEERREGYISQADWIRAEDKLRNSLNLTTSQVNTHKKALEAEDKQLKKTAQELKTVSQRLDLYTKALQDLNAQKNKGLLTTKQMEQKEEQLRKQYRLNEKQVNDTRKAIENKNKTLDKSSSSTDALTRTTRRLAQAYTLLLAGGKAIDAIGSSIEHFGEIEGGMTKVEKTTGLAREAVFELKDELNDMAMNITPTATKELLNYSEVAGQLGVTSEQGILDLVVAADALQNSTNLAGEEAVTLLTRMLMMSGEGVEGIHSLSSAVTELGNTTATTEDEIVHMGKEVLTAGASIGISTDQAVAWGATLKEAGQTAERSRTAIQRLAGMIKKASVEGGQDLLELSKITGLTGKAIQDGLGEEPEKVLLAFVEGLNRVKEEGGVVATTLENMGIQSLESQAVLEKLGDVSLRLAQNMNTASDAYIAQDRHLIEASKAYADQESAIGRVVNRLNVLQEHLGEAFSDDTNSAIKTTTGIIDDYEDAIIALGQITSDTIGGMVELLEPWNDALDATGTALLKVGATFKAVFNSFQSGMDVIILGWQKIAFNVARVTGETDEQLSYLATAIENTKSRILKNNQDLADSQALLFGEMSHSYIDLRDAIKENEKAVESLTERQKLELKGLMDLRTFSKEDDKRRRELTDIIVRQTRVQEIAENQAELSAKNEKARVEEKLRSDRTQAESNEKAKQLFSDLIKSEQTLTEYTKELTAARNQGSISQKEYNEKYEVAKRLQEINIEQTKASTVAQENLNKKKIEEIETAVSFVELTKDETEASTKLIERIQEKEAEIQKLLIAQVGLNENSSAYIELQAEITGLTDEAIVSLKELNQLRELEDLTLSEVLEVQEKHVAQLAELKRLRDEDKITIQEYNEEVGKLSTVTKFLNDNIADVIATQKEKAKEDEKAIKNAEKIAEAKDKEAKKSAETALKNEYEAKTVKELINVKKEHDKALDKLLLQYENGEITWAKYQLELEKMSVVTDILSKALANNTSEVAKNIQQLDEQAEAMSRNEKVAERFAERTEQRARTQASMLTASASSFDATTASASELGAEIETLEGRIYQNSKVMRGSWFYELAASQVELDKASLATAKQAKAVLQLQERYERMQAPTIESTKAIERSINAMGDLDNADLNSLRDEVESTIGMFNDLRESINDSLDSVEDRLSALKGEEKAIQDRAHAKELEEAEALREAAKGDKEAVQKADDLIKKLKQAQKIESDNLKAELAATKAEVADKATEDATSEESYNIAKKTTGATVNDNVSSTISTSNVQPIIINLGAKSTELTANKDDIMNLLTDMGYTLS